MISNRPWKLWADRAPTFVIAPHRSRSTLLQRILNAHPRLVIWGEHGGLINKLAELDATAGYFWNVAMPMEGRNLEQLSSKPVSTELPFDPWTNPWDREQYLDFCRRFLLKTFQKGLKPGQRWGLKEIRYNSPEVCGFLSTLFPKSRFIVVRRNMLDLCVSNILSEWSIEYLNQVNAGANESTAEAVISDCCYAVTAVDWQLHATATLLGDRALTIDSAEIATRTDDIFAFLRLRVSPSTRRKVGEVVASKVGTTNKQRSAGMIDRKLIESIAPKLLIEARREISHEGLDVGRLRRSNTKGAYSFLVGDHDLRETNLSSMFW